MTRSSENNNFRQLPDYLQGLSVNQNPDSRIFYYQDLTSTMITAREIVDSSTARHGDLVVAEQQSGGRGRRGRKWLSPVGGLWFSVILRPGIKPDQNQLIALAAAVAVVESIRLHTDLVAEIKWPNDVLISNRKVCGIAVDLVMGPGSNPWVILGIGVNVNNDMQHLPTEVQQIATSLSNETKIKLNRKPIIDSILVKLFSNLKLLKYNSQQLLNIWQKYDITINSNIRVYPADGSQPFTGQAVAIDSLGALIIKDNNSQIKRVLAADVSIRVAN